jgi:hypothetical protein
LLGWVKPLLVPVDKVGMYDFDTRLVFRTASALLALVLLVGAVVLLLARTGVLGPSPAEVMLLDALLVAIPLAAVLAVLAGVLHLRRRNR